MFDRGPGVDVMAASSGRRSRLSPVTWSKNKENSRSGVGGVGWSCFSMGHLQGRTGRSPHPSKALENPE